MLAQPGHVRDELAQQRAAVLPRARRCSERLRLDNGPGPPGQDIALSRTLPWRTVRERQSLRSLQVRASCMRSAPSHPQPDKEPSHRMPRRYVSSTPRSVPALCRADAGCRCAVRCQRPRPAPVCARPRLTVVALTADPGVPGDLVRAHPGIGSRTSFTSRRQKRSPCLRGSARSLAAPGSAVGLALSQVCSSRPRCTDRAAEFTHSCVFGGLTRGKRGREDRPHRIQPSRCDRSRPVKCGAAGGCCCTFTDVGRTVGGGLDASSWRQIRQWGGPQDRAFGELAYQLRDCAPAGWSTIKTAALTEGSSGTTWLQMARPTAARPNSSSPSMRWWRKLAEALALSHAISAHAA
jgi:hypothetical protein